jgi:hypothetical protein
VDAEYSSQGALSAGASYERTAPEQLCQRFYFKRRKHSR